VVVLVVVPKYLIFPFGVLFLSQGKLARLVIALQTTLVEMDLLL